MGRNALQSLRADQNFSRARRETLAQRLSLGGLRHHGVARLVAQAQFGQFIDTFVRAQGEDTETLRMARGHVQGVEPDGAGRPQYGEILHRAHDRYASAATGSTAVRASMRSSTPPCPGSKTPLSFTPACRFNADSNKSP